MNLQTTLLGAWLLASGAFLLAADAPEESAKTNKQSKAEKNTNTVSKASKGPEANKAAEASKAVETQARKGMPNFFQKVEDGRSVRIAFFGGSITAQDGWRPKTLSALRRQYPNANIKEINAAIGGTGSDLGVFRFRHDVLDHDPDLVFVEFAVNDAASSPEHITRCMEGIVRQAWDLEPDIDFCFVYTIAGNMLETYQAGKVPRSVTTMEAVAAHYGIPSMNLGVEVAKLAKEGKLLFKAERPKSEEDKAALNGKILFSPDGVHPYPDSGHEVYLQAVLRSMPIIRGDRKPERHVLAKPLAADNYEKAKLVQLSKARLSAGWQKLDPATNSIARVFQNRMPEMWKAEQPGESIAFSFKGTAAGIYDLLGPDCGQVLVTLDDDAPVVRPRFDSFSTYHRLGTLNVASGLPNGLHTAKLEIAPEQPDKAKILAQRQEKIDDPKRYDGTAWYAGWIMLIGDLVDKP